MRTRTLLLLAVACGLVILVAGVVQLLRIAGQDETAEFSPLGSEVRVGDLEVVVDSYDESGGTTDGTGDTGYDPRGHRIERSAGVLDAQRVRIGVSHRTLAGAALPFRCRADSS